jgi:hypothetical protein
LSRFEISEVNIEGIEAPDGGCVSRSVQRSGARQHKRIVDAMPEFFEVRQHGWCSQRFPGNSCESLCAARLIASCAYFSNQTAQWQTHAHLDA